MFSAGTQAALDSVTSPVAALAISPTAQVNFSGQVGSWTVQGGLPSKASGTLAIGIIDWGDGKTSRAKLVDDGSGVVRITGQHVWAKAGAFQLKVTIDEYPRAHPAQLTLIGQDSTTITVVPKPHVVKIKGTFTGSFTQSSFIPDVPTSYLLTGTGKAGTLGTSDLSGSITPPGSIRLPGSTRHYTGELTLTNSSGTVRFDIDAVSGASSSVSSLPRRLSYTLTGGTGTYSNAIGKGSIALAINLDTATFLMVVS
jgi:hypothetical protein